jgi:hypothetical protein
VRCLLDENLSPKLRHCLGDHEVVTAVYAGFGGLKNGELLAAVEAAGFDILVTADKTLQYEQNMEGRTLAIVSLSANDWQIIEPHVHKILAAVEASCPGSFITVECGTFSRRNPRPPTLGPK